MTDKELKQLLSEANAHVSRMTPSEHKAMYKAQRDGYAKAEASWPKARFKIDSVTGGKIYESYEDYLND